MQRIILFYRESTEDSKPCSEPANGHLLADLAASCAVGHVDWRSSELLQLYSCTAVRLSKEEIVEITV